MKNKKILLPLACLGVISSVLTCGQSPVAADSANSQLGTLLSSYYHNGYYVKDTKINITSAAVEELNEYGGFHQSTLLARTTYYTPDALWMSRGNGKYSYYGTDNEGNVTNATATEALVTPENIKIAVKKGVNTATQTWDDVDVGMEGYYITLKDILETDASVWQVNGNVYSSVDADVIEMFKGFTAPCYLGFTQETGNYIDLEKVEIEEVNHKLILRLYAHEGDSGKLLAGSNNVFSQAEITPSHAISSVRYEDSVYHGGECSICEKVGLVEHELDNNECECGAIVKQNVVWSMNLVADVAVENATTDQLKAHGIDFLTKEAGYVKIDKGTNLLKIAGEKPLSFVLESSATVNITVDQWYQYEGQFAVKDANENIVAPVNNGGLEIVEESGKFNVVGSGNVLSYTLEAGKYYLAGHKDGVGKRVNISGFEVITSKVGHNHSSYTKHDAVEADCTNPGNVLYYTCGGCDAVLDADYNEINSPIIDAVGHNTQGATYKDETHHTGSCTVCGAEGDLEHSFDENHECACGARNVTIYTMDPSKITNTSYGSSDITDGLLESFGLGILKTTGMTGLKQIVAAGTSYPAQIRVSGKSYVFTVEDTTTVTVNLCMWNNTASSFAIKNESNGQLITANEDNISAKYNDIAGEYAVKGNMTVTYTLEAGTYRFWNSCGVRVGIYGLEFVVSGVVAPAQ